MNAIPFTGKKLDLGTLRRPIEIVVLVEKGRPKIWLFPVKPDENDILVIFCHNLSVLRSKRAQRILINLLLVPFEVPCNLLLLFSLKIYFNG